MEANPVRIVRYFDGEKQGINPLFQRRTRGISEIGNRYGMTLCPYLPSTVCKGPISWVQWYQCQQGMVLIGATKHLIIDGQQRLPAIAVMMCGLRDSCDEKRSAQIQDNLVNRHYEGRQTI